MLDGKVRLSPEELESKHVAAEATMRSYSYAKPPAVTTGKGGVALGRGEFIKAAVQIVKKRGGENNLHYHTNGDSFWMVLKGRVRFYGPGDRVLGEYGPMEGTITPCYARYWFENVGEEDLEILHVTAPNSGRTDLTPQRHKIGTGQKFSALKE